MKDSALRQQRLVFYTQDIERLHTELDAFLELSKSRCVMLIDRDGHLVTRRGESFNTSEDTISALVAGSFAATCEIAHLLGETEFSVMFHQGQRDSIQLQLVGSRTLMATLFDDRTNLGLVRFYAQETSSRLRAIFDSILAENRTTDLGAGFSKDATAALDELF
jgi:predicted regulator of Ras-like GTPase activity (Roadblock/LC7/MglB family)